MHRAPDRRERRIRVEPEARHQHLEGDAVLHMGELGAIVVEADRFLWALTGPRDPCKFRLAIDEALDEPGARQPVNPGCCAGRPDALLESLAVERAQTALGEARFAAAMHRGVGALQFG